MKVIDTLVDSGDRLLSRRYRSVGTQTDPSMFSVQTNQISEAELEETGSD